MMFNEADLICELERASLVKFVIYDRAGDESIVHEMRGGGITRLIKMIQTCHCEEHLPPVGAEKGKP